jgi:regulator of protease activity HflC (stomatin/prohibitin superfamily)
MSEFLRVLLDSIAYIWPLRTVDRWERAVYSVCGRWVFEVGPGVYPIVPWFCEVRQLSVVTAILGTPRQDITLSDGSTLTFSATAKVRVVNALVACISVDDYHETTQELIGSVLAERMAEVDAARLAPEGRKRLLTDLRKWVNQESQEWGIEVSHLRFTTFVLNVKTYRLLQESGPIAPW